MIVYNLLLSLQPNEGNFFVVIVIVAINIAIGTPLNILYTLYIHYIWWLVAPTSSSSYAIVIATVSSIRFFLLLLFVIDQNSILVLSACLNFQFEFFKWALKLSWFVCVCVCVKILFCFTHKMYASTNWKSQQQSLRSNNEVKKWKKEIEYNHNNSSSNNNVNNVRAIHSGIEMDIV